MFSSSQGLQCVHLISETPSDQMQNVLSAVTRTLLSLSLVTMVYYCDSIVQRKLLETYELLISLKPWRVNHG